MKWDGPVPDSEIIGNREVLPVVRVKPYSGCFFECCSETGTRIRFAPTLGCLFSKQLEKLVLYKTLIADYLAGMRVFPVVVGVLLTTAAVNGFAQSVTSTGAGTIAGAVNDGNTHAGLSGIAVTAVRSGLPPFSQTITSGSNGAFQLQGLPTGTYTLCAQAPAGGYLNPCGNGAVPLQVNLTAGQISGGNVVNMRPGSVLNVRVQDPQQLVTPTINPTSGSPKPPDLLVGVWGPGSPGSQFYPAWISATDSAGIDYQVTIPLDTKLALHISSKHFKLANAGGSALNGNFDQVNFQHATGDANPKSFTYSVAGVLP
jgi:hypothetical protein